MVTFKKGSTGAELEAYNAIAGTVHGKPVVRMLENYHKELGDLTVKSWNVMKTPKPKVEGKPQEYRYDMVIEFGV